MKIASKLRINDIIKLFRFITGLFLVFLSNPTFSQANVIFETFPQDIQLIQRNRFNQATVPIIGKVYTENFSHIALQVFKNEKTIFYQKIKLQYQNQSPLNAAFSFLPVIEAELSEYRFSVYIFKNDDSTFVKEAKEVVCGDNILVYGQSNALSNPSEELERFSGDNKFGRSTYAIFDKNEFLWVSTQKWNYWSAGLMGLGIQKQLIDKYKIPIGIINGSEGNKSIDELSLRDEKFHNDVSTIYGRLLKRTQMLGVEKNLKIMIWRQGESEATNPNYKNDYNIKFDKFRKQLLEDYPSLEKIYTFQNNIYFGNNVLAGDIRDFQRKINTIYEDCEVMSTFGTTSFDGLHYLLEGYEQNTTDISRLIARDFHKSTDTLEIDAPNIQSIYFSANKDSLILEFDKFQKMQFPKDEPAINNNPSKNIKDYIYLDGKSGYIESGIGSDNYIILKLKTPLDAQKITYTPENYSLEFISILPGITQIKNSREVRALTFKDFSVKTINEIQIESLNADWETGSESKISLRWQGFKFRNYQFVIERAELSPTNFKEIAIVNSDKFIDSTVLKGIKYYYRIRIKQFDNYSPFSNVVEILPILPLENEPIISNNLSVYPNPVLKGEKINLNLLSEKAFKTIQIRNIQGKTFETIHHSNQLTQLDTYNLASGIYLIEVILEDNTKLIKKFVIQ
jgi:hypothetical protein